MSCKGREAANGCRADLAYFERYAFAAVRMIDVRAPTTDGRESLLGRYTQPEPEPILLLDKLKLELPIQSLPKIATVTVNSPRSPQCRFFQVRPT